MPDWPLVVTIVVGFTKMLDCLLVVTIVVDVIEMQEKICVKIKRFGLEVHMSSVPTHCTFVHMTCSTSLIS